MIAKASHLGDFTYFTLQAEIIFLAFLKHNFTHFVKHTLVILIEKFIRVPNHTQMKNNHYM